LSAAPRFWIGVASRDHVRRGVAGGFCQLGHGKAAPIRRLAPGDWIAYYSPRESYPDGALLQAFTAIGEVSWGAAFRRGLFLAASPGCNRNANYGGVEKNNFHRVSPV